MNANKLQKWILLANRALQDHPHGDLDYYFRALLLYEMASFPGLRGLLSIRTARLVLPIWEQHYGTSRIFKVALDLAQRCLVDEVVDLGWVRYLGSRIQSALLNLGLSHHEQIIGCAGFSVLQALRECVRDRTRHFPSEPEQYQLDADLQPDQLDTYFHAAVACANGPIGFAGSNPKRRRLFWEWWLEKAISSTIRSAATICDQLDQNTSLCDEEIGSLACVDVPSCQQVLEVMTEIGHTPRTHIIFDRLWDSRFRHQRGFYFASHREKIASLTSENVFGISWPICNDCKEFLRALSRHHRQFRMLRDVEGVWIFKPEGEFTFLATPRGKTTQPGIMTSKLRHEAECSHRGQERAVSRFSRTPSPFDTPGLPKRCTV